MSTTIMVDYDCGHSYEIPPILDDDQTFLGNAKIADRLIAMIDMQHDMEHPECAFSAWETIMSSGGDMTIRVKEASDLWGRLLETQPSLAR